jgi:predicted metal-dependent enzyme (double-stranded beta helix superfamily)
MPASVFDDFAREAARLVDDPHAIAARLQPLLGTEGWLAAEHERGSEEGYRQHLLHVSACRRLSVVALVWLPGQATPIHDHVSWCVVGVHRGEEHETHFREIEHGGRRGLVPVGEVVARPGHVEALVPPAGDIHLVRASGTEKTISIHVYGADIEQRGTSILRTFDDHEVLRSPRAERGPEELQRRGAAREGRDLREVGEHVADELVAAS